jgi:hypothetical protein
MREKLQIIARSTARHAKPARAGDAFVYQLTMMSKQYPQGYSFNVVGGEHELEANQQDPLFSHSRSDSLRTCHHCMRVAA